MWLVGLQKKLSNSDLKVCEKKKHHVLVQVSEEALEISGFSRMFHKLATPSFSPSSRVFSRSCCLSFSSGRGVTHAPALSSHTEEARSETWITQGSRSALGPIERGPHRVRGAQWQRLASKCLHRQAESVDLSTMASPHISIIVMLLTIVNIIQM